MTIIELEERATRLAEDLLNHLPQVTPECRRRMDNLARVARTVAIGLGSVDDAPKPKAKKAPKPKAK